MAALLDRDEAVAVVDRLLRRMIPDEQEDAWIDLVERSLGIPPGKLRALVFSNEDASAEELIDAALEAD